MIICDKCVHKMSCIDYGTKTECKYCDPITNEEWLRSCNTEQLAEAIYECVMTHPWHISKEVILEWLKQPHTI